MKKFSAIISLFIILIITLFSWSCGDISITNLGIPTKTRFEKGVSARCVWDMKVYNGVLYIGSGDYESNTAPTDVWAYDIKTNKWNNSASILEEAVVRFNLINDSLVIAGVDPRDNGAFGSYYRLENGAWVQYKNLPNTVHAFDIVKFNDAIFVGVGGEPGFSPMLISYDQGVTFSSVAFYKDNQVYDLTCYDYSRTYELFEIDGKLYALVIHVLGNRAKVELHEFKNGRFNYIKDDVELWVTDGLTDNFFNSKGEFKGNFFHASDYLYVWDGVSHHRINLPNYQRVSQFRIYDNKMYILCYEKLQGDKNQPYKVNIYQTEQGTENFIELCSFNFEVPPISFDKEGLTFFIGFGDKVREHDKNGTVLRIDIKEEIFNKTNN